MVWSEIRDVEGNERGAKGRKVGSVLECVEVLVSNLTTFELRLCYLLELLDDSVSRRFELDWLKYFRT
jgi:hypothetical protein